MDSPQDIEPSSSFIKENTDKPGFSINDLTGDIQRQIPIMVVLFMIGWICLDGSLKSEMCMDKFEDKSDNDSAVTVNLIYNMGLGFAIGSAITSGISTSLVTAKMRYSVTLAMGIVAIIAISSYTELKDCSDAMKIHKQKAIMYMILGFAIGVFVTGISKQIALGNDAYYGSLFVVSALAVIAFTSMSINLTDRCKNKGDLTEVEMDSIKSFRTIAIVLLVLALVALLIVSAAAAYLKDFIPY